MQKELINERIALWDNLKFFLIVTVVCGHLADVFTSNSDIAKSIYLFVYAFHMPLFIYISGLFHRDKNILKDVIFYCSIGIFIKIIDIIICFIDNRSPTVSLFSDNWISWYMFALAGFSVITYIIRYQNKMYILLFSVILACIAGYDKDVSDFLYLSSSKYSK